MAILSPGPLDPMPRCAAGRNQSIEPLTLQRAQQGDEIAFGELLRAYRPWVTSIVRRAVWRREDVEDVVQEVSLRLYRALGQLQAADAFDTWLYRMTVNASWDYLRRQRGIELCWADLTEEQTRAAIGSAGMRRSAEQREQVRARERLDSILAAVSHLDRQLLLRKEMEGLSLKELSQLYQIRGDTLKVRLCRARKRIARASRDARRPAQSAGTASSPRCAAVTAET